VPTNPTKLMVEHLQANPDAIPGCAASVVLETSAVGSTDMLDAFIAEHKLDLTAEREAEDDTVVVLLHMGVHGSATQFHIEQCCYNEADFRCADERGHQPQSEPIIADNELKSVCSTTIDCKVLCESMNAAMEAVGSACRSRVSTDPGRFVCNWIFYQSIHRTLHNKNTHSLFLHVPSFKVYTQEQQFAYLQAFVACLGSQLALIA
jgi:pyrrolidone-carboxylate peptidase